MMVQLHQWWQSLDQAARFALFLTPTVWLLAELVKQVISKLNQKWLAGLLGGAVVLGVVVWLLSLNYAIPTPEPKASRLTVYVETAKGKVTNVAMKLKQGFASAGHDADYKELTPALSLTKPTIYLNPNTEPVRKEAEQVFTSLGIKFSDFFVEAFPARYQAKIGQNEVHIFLP